MYEPLEAYLQEVKAQLKALPRAEREDEISEMRLHLQAIINDSVKRGVSESDAVASAIAQFGESGEVGRDLKRAWDEKSESWLRAIGAGIFVAVCNEFLLAANAMIFFLTDIYVFHHQDIWNGPNVSTRMRIAQAITTTFIWLSPLIAGWLGQKIAPKRIVLSVVPIYLATAFFSWRLHFTNDDMYKIVLLFLPLVCLGASSRKWWTKKQARRLIQN